MYIAPARQELTQPCVKLLTMIGKMTPPSELPEAMIPNAKARFLKNHVVIVVIAGKKIMLAPTLEQIPVVLVSLEAGNIRRCKFIP